MLTRDNLQRRNHVELSSQQVNCDVLSNVDRKVVIEALYFNISYFFPVSNLSISLNITIRSLWLVNI